jgi:hypothetical protein
MTTLFCKIPPFLPFPKGGNPSLERGVREDFINHKYLYIFSDTTLIFQRLPHQKINYSEALFTKSPSSPFAKGGFSTQFPEEPLFEHSTNYVLNLINDNKSRESDKEIQWYHCC